LKILTVILTLVFFTGQTDHKPPAPPTATTPEQVLVISIDGARPDAIQQVDTPHIDALAERGAFTWQAETILPPATLPAHASMLTGLNVDEHGIDYNSYRPGSIDTPTFLLRTHEAGYRTAMAIGKEKLSQFRQSDDVGYTFARLGDRSVVNAALDFLDDGYEVIFVHLPNPDFFGHLIGWMSDPYLYELQNTDAQIGRLLDGYAERNLLDNTLVILTADHGGHDTEHGQDIPEDRLIPWMIAGPGIQSDYEISAPVSVMDTAHTVLYTLGLDRPESDSGGHVVREAFEVSTE
jgi:predicted AlkP superfamily pyrophosphatase or phosphodiesterase